MIGNNSNETKGFWSYFLDVATLISMFVLFAKTMEVMSAIAPLTLFGLGGLSYIYGFVVAGLIEGSIIAISFIPAFGSNPAAQAYKWTLFGISAWCQFMDKTIVIDQMKNSNAYTEVWIGLTYAIPVIIALGLIIVAQSNQKTEKPMPWKGVRNMFGGQLDKFLNGSNPDTVSNVPVMVANALETKKAALDQKEPEVEETGKRKVRHE